MSEKYGAEHVLQHCNMFPSRRWCLNGLKTQQISMRSLTLSGHIKTAEQRTIIQQYGDW